MIENDVLTQEYTIEGWDFTRAGEASCEIKDTLKQVGIPPDILKRIAIACYEAEMNVVMYAKSATLRCEISPELIIITFSIYLYKRTRLNWTLKSAACMSAIC